MSRICRFDGIEDKGLGYKHSRFCLGEVAKSAMYTNDIEIEKDLTLATLDFRYHGAARDESAKLLNAFERPSVCSVPKGM